MDALIANLERMLEQGNDGASLRFALASRYLAIGAAESACRHAEVAVALDPDYSAAWKLLGTARAECGQPGQAAAAYEQGIAVAERRGDRQAAKEMRVFLNRLRKQSGEPPSDAGGEG